MIAQRDGEWAGIPMPMEGEQLVIEPKYYKAKELMEMCGQDEGPPGPLAGATLRGRFYSTAKSCDIYIVDHDGKVTWGFVPAVHHFELDLRTLGCADAWGMDQEFNALNTLGELVNQRQLKQYMLTGMFLETSKRSGKTYCFRRLKPTVVIHAPKGKMRILTTLCLHPIAYYSGSWAGAMCPTDDVIAHLMLMRGDEPMFWRRANQHAAHRPEAGL